MNLTLCHTGSKSDLDRDWFAERKLDGIRAYTHDGRLYTRSDREVTRKFPEIDVPGDVVYDGEIITGDFEFRTVNRRKQVEKPHKIELLADKYPAFYIVFDCLERDGRDLRNEALRERKDAIDLADRGPHVVQITHTIDPHDLWAQVVENDVEGVVLKDPESAYAGERTDEWLKIKNWLEETFPIEGWETTENDGFVIYVDIGTAEPQKVVVNGQSDQADVRDGAEVAAVQFLERSKNDRLRKPSVKEIT